MRIVLDVTSCAKERRGGIGNYGAQLVQGLRRVAPDHELVMALRPQRWGQRELVADLCAGGAPRLLLDRLNPLTLRRPVDVFHGVGVRLPARGGFPRTVTLHDLNVFEFPELASDDWRRTRQARIRQTVARADLLLSYSEQGAAALGQYLGVARERVRVVPLGVDTSHFRRPDDAALARVSAKHRLDDKPYVVMVGEYSTRKNPHGLVEAFAASGLAPRWRLVLGGPRGENAEALAADGAARGLDDDTLRLPGWVDDDELPALLAGAGFCVCAARHEGFGLPVLEAQACGTPVVSSDRGALPETLGGLGLAFDPDDLEAFAGALSQMAGDDPLRSELARKGPLRVAEGYTWDHVARATLAVYEELAGQARSPTT
jgi:glycosyltransferase involved in cell wall biosynthesis